MAKRPIVAVLYDFDSTLAVSDMQNFSFIPSMGMTPAEFWGGTTEWSKKTGCERTLSYLFYMMHTAKEKGIKMTKEWLAEQGKAIKFFPGVETWFKRINDYGREHHVKVEHYLISSGNKEIVQGCKIAKEFKVIYGCEFVFDKETKEPIWPKQVINFTQKTQYFYRI
nr:haloacid dehalogenase-like hydrolase [Bacilli bacterium]